MSMCRWCFMAAALGLVWGCGEFAVNALARTKSSPGKVRRVDRYGDPLPPHALFRLGTVPLMRHTGMIRALAFSADGKTLTSLDDAGEIHRWEVVTGKQLFYRRKGTTKVDPYYLGVRGDFVIGPRLRHMERRDAKTGKLLGHLKHYPPQGIQCGTMSPDNKYFVAMHNDGIFVWDVNTGQLRRFFAVNLHGRPTFVPVTVSAGAKWFAYIDFHGAIVIRDGWFGLPIKRWYPEGRGKLTDVLAMSADAKWLASGHTSSGKVYVWNLTNGKKQVTLSIPMKFFDHLTFSPDGLFLAVAHDMGSVTLWNTRTGKRVRRWDDFRSSIRVLTFSPNGNLLAAACGFDNFIRIWDVSSGKQRFQAPGHQAPVTLAGFTRDGRTLVTGNENVLSYKLSPKPRVCVWDSQTGKLQRQFTWEYRRGSLSQVEHEHGWLGLAKKDGTVVFRHLPTGKTYEFPHTGYAVAKMVLSPDGRWLAAMTIDPAAPGYIHSQSGRVLAKSTMIHLWHMKTKKKRGELSSPYCADIFFSGDATRIACVCRRPPKANSENLKSVLEFWNTKSTRIIKSVPFDYRGLALTGENPFSPDGNHFRLLVYQNNQSFLWRWNVDTGQLVHQEEVKHNIHAHATHPSGRLVITTSEFYHVTTQRIKRRIDLKEKVTGETVYSWDHDEGSAYVFAFSKRGAMLALGNRNGDITVFDLRMQKQIAYFKGHRDSVASLAFSPDGSRLVSGSDDTTLLVWDLKPFQNKRRKKSAVLSAKNLETLWKQLAHEDAKKAWQAVTQLVQAPQNAVPFLRHKLQPMKAPNAKTLEQAIRALDSRRFAIRTNAMKQLTAYGALAEPALRRALANKPTLEVHLRIRKLLSQIRQVGRTPQRLQQMRALQALEWISDAEARRLLRRLTTGHAEAWLTEEARRTLTRIRS